ncbi:MAG: S-layer protein, partial [DPANN group archaeon]|nr:S-layer protein [DPANN group archaeon]
MENFVLKTKNAIKRIAAIGIGAVMVGATMGAAFAQLENYPSPFVKDNKFVGLIVVGAAAQPADVIGATDIAATLAQSVSVTPGTSTVTGGKAYDVPLGTALKTKFGTTMTATDLAGFYDSSVTLDLGGSTNSYNVKDTLTLGDGIRVTTGFTEASTSKDWGKDIWLMTNSTGQISYNYVFKSVLKGANNLTAASSTDPAEIQFLGKKLTITGATTSSITAQIASEYYMNFGDTVTIEGKTVKLVNVGSGTTAAVIVSVDGTTGTVSGTTETKVNGLRFKIKSTFSSDTPAERAATLLVGSDVSKTYTNSDPYIGQPTTDYDWQWSLVNLETTSPTIGITYAKSLVNPSSTNKPIKAGSSIAAPDGSYFKVAVGDPTTSSYKDYTFNGLGIADLYSAAGNNTVFTSAAYGLEISASGGGKNGFYTATNNTYTDKMFVQGTHSNASTVTLTVYWGNPNDGNHYEPTGVSVTNYTALNDAKIATIQTPDTSTGLGLYLHVNAGAGDKAQIVVAGLQNITQNITLTGTGDTIKFLGSVTGTATADDLYISSTDVSTYDA